MQSIQFFSFLIAIANAAIWIVGGLLIRNKFDIILNMISRKPIPQGLISSDNQESVNKSVRFIGTLIIIIGICKALISFSYLDFLGF